MTVQFEGWQLLLLTLLKNEHAIDGVVLGRVGVDGPEMGV